MERFYLSGVVTISVNTEVDANSLEEAIEIAKERNLCRVHVSNSYNISENWMCGEELDGEVQEIANGGEI